MMADRHFDIRHPDYYKPGTRLWYKRPVNDRYYEQIKNGAPEAVAQREYELYLEHKFVAGDIVVVQRDKILSPFYMKDGLYRVASALPSHGGTWGMVVQECVSWDPMLLGAEIHIDPDVCEWHSVDDMVFARRTRTITRPIIIDKRTT